MRFCSLPLMLFFISSSTISADTGPFPDLDLKDPAVLQEATRVLEEEVKLAARPQTYLVIDLVTRSIHIKGQGVDLFRIPIAAWSFKSPEVVTGTYRLIARPPIVRRKIDPSASAIQDPISLADMPVDYTLFFTPPLTIDVMPLPDTHPLQWIEAHGKSWWRALKAWSASFSRGQPLPTVPYLQLECSAEQARSLAWSIVDGMPLVIRRATDKK